MKFLRKFTKKQIMLGIILVAVLILLITYLSFTIFFNSHYWFRTIINGVNCSGKSIEEVEQTITDEINVYQLVLEQRGGKTETMKGVDILLKPKFDGSLNQELKAQNSFAWVISLFKKSTIEVETMVEYDQAEFQSVVKRLQCLSPSNVTNPRNAYISDYIPGTGYEIVPEEEGNLLVPKTLENVLKEAIINLKETVSLEEMDCYEKPKYRADNKELAALLEEMNTYVKTTINYEFGDDKVILDGTAISQWLVVDKFQVALDEEKAAEYVKNLASERNTAYKPKSLKTSYGATITISQGDYGWWIDQESELEQLLVDIKTGKEINREPEYKQRASSFGTNDYGSTYVEINLTAQHLFFYKNGSLLVESDLVSGNLSKGYDTPPGAYSITYTQRDAVLRGEDYETPVSYWMPFNRGVGLHDANWRRDFGGNYYKYGGSHGCINLPYNVAKKIFENINAGDPVLVYELAGTESAKATAQDSASSVTSAISAIGEVTLESGGAIENARNQYNSLSDTARGYVSNYDTLINAEEVYAALLAEQDGIMQAQNEAQAVVDAIASIGEVTEDTGQAIRNARGMYDALSDSAKGYVGNYDSLVAAEEAFAAL